MPTLDTYRQNLAMRGKYNGQVRKYNADEIVEATWYNDLATRTCYLFDYDHDPQPLELNDLVPDATMQTPVDLKYIVNSSQTLDKDAISYHIMFKPSEEDKSSMVKYYDMNFKNRYNAKFPCGLYVLIPDDKGKYNKWLIVASANVNDPQFPTYEVLRCDYLFQWIHDNKRYQMCGVLRSQNSYNSGIWQEYKVSTPEDQQKAILPMTRTTEHLFYNQRMIIDNKVLTEPRTWLLSKVNRLSSNGLAMFTFAEDKFDQHKDYIELDNNGNVIGMWADYYAYGDATPIEPKEPESTLTSSISYSGIKPEVKIGGSYKKFTVTFDEDGKEIPYQGGDWSYGIKDGDIIKPINLADNIISVLTHLDSTDVNTNQIKVRFDGGDEYLNKVLVITHTVTIDGYSPITSSVLMNIVGL